MLHQFKHSHRNYEYLLVKRGILNGMDTFFSCRNSDCKICLSDDWIALVSLFLSCAYSNRVPDGGLNPESLRHDLRRFARVVG